MRKTLVVFAMVFLAACIPASPDYLAPVESYLIEHVSHAYFGGKVFCTYDVLGEALQAGMADVYVWALCGEYYLDKDVLTLGTASSLPVALHMRKGNGSFAVTSHEVPSDGIDYGVSIQRIFPADAIEKMCMTVADCYNERAERLEKAVEQKAREYYGLK